MEQKPLVSTIITTYRRPELVSRSVDSVLGQTYPNIEVIVVDDNVPDSQYRKDTEKVMAKYIDDSRVIYIKHSVNKRQAAALNTGIRMSKGEYICFLDDDDEFMPQKIEKQVNELEKYKKDSNVGGAFSNVLLNNHGKLDRTHYTIKQCSRNLIYPMLTGSVSYFGGTAILKRQIFDKLTGFNENLIRHVDYEFFTRFFNYFRLILIEEPLTKINIEGIRNNPKADRYLEAKEIFFKDVEQYLQIVDPKERKEIYSTNYYDVALSFFANGFFKKGCKILKKALHFKNLNFPEWVLLAKVIIKKNILHR